MEKRKIRSKFLKVSCPRCSNSQIIFGKSSLKMKCLKCNYLLTKTSGGKTKVRAQVRRML